MCKQGHCSAEEDDMYSNTEYQWNDVPIHAVGLLRDREDCRWRWGDHLVPDLTKEPFSEEEVKIVMDQHELVGNRWAEIAKYLPGRTGNDVQMFWEALMKNKDKLRNEDMNTEVNVNITSSSSVNKSESPKGNEVVEVEETGCKNTNNEERIAEFKEFEDNNAWAYEVEEHHMYLGLMNNPCTSSDFEVDDDYFKLWNFP